MGLGSRGRTVANEFLTNDPTELAESFVSEYLGRTPEYIDVAEYAEENVIDEDILSDEFLAEVFQEVNKTLDTVAQRFDERNK